MSLLLYLAVTIALVSVWSRFVRRVAPAIGLVLIVMPMTFTGRALLTGRVYAPVDLAFAYEPLKDPRITPHDIALSDLYCQIIPWQQAVRSALARGEWPLWNPYILCGDILAAAAQPAVYDPFNLTGLLLPLPHAITFGGSLTFFLAGFFTYAFARALGRGEIASLIAAAVFMFGGMMAFFAGWPLGRTWAFLPLVLCGVRRVVHERKAGVLLCALVLVIVAGHPESTLHVVAVGLVYGIFELCVERKNIFRTMASAAGAGIAALLLTAIYLLPFAEASSQSLEHYIRTGLYAPTPYERLAPPEERAHRMGRTFLPFFDGQPWRGESSPKWDALNARAGGLAFALALAALLVAPRRAETWFFAALAVVCLGLTFGSWPFAHALHAVPLFDIAINERFAFAAVFAVAMLAAIAIDALQPRVAAVLIAAGAVLAVAAMLTHTWTLMPAELLPLAAVALLVLMRWRYTPIAILALVLIQRAIVDGGIYPALPRDLFYPRAPVLDAVRTGDRIIGVGQTLIPNTSAMYGLHDARGYEAMTFRRLADTYMLWSRFQVAWFNVVDDPSRPFLSFLNVRYILDGTRLTENQSVLPRAFVPPRVRYERDGKQVLEQMKGASDFSQVAWIEAPSYEPQDAPNGPGRLAVRRDGSAFDIDAQMDGAGWIVISETGWKGWRAYIDGRRVEWLFANHAFLGIHVPAGRHRLRLVYLPESFTRGRTITLATLALLALWSGALLARRPAG